jgi:hypothetical protein
MTDGGSTGGGGREGGKSGTADGKGRARWTVDGHYNRRSRSRAE